MMADVKGMSMGADVDVWNCAFLMQSGELVRIPMTRAALDKALDSMPLKGERLLLHGTDTNGRPFAVRLDRVDSIISREA